MKHPLLRAAAAACFFLATTPGTAQVQTEVPPVVPGAKPVTTERIQNDVLPFFGKRLCFDAVCR